MLSWDTAPIGLKLSIELFEVQELEMTLSGTLLVLNSLTSLKQNLKIVLHLSLFLLPVLTSLSVSNSQA